MSHNWDIPPAWEDMIGSAPDDVEEPRPQPKPSKGKKSPPRLGWWRQRVRKLRPLCNEVFPPLKYAVPHLIPQGVTLLVGRPKIRKSWFMLQIACAVAKGQITLTTLNGDPPPHGDVLYLDLEGNKRRLQDRVTQYYGTDERNWPEQFDYVFDWLPLDEGGLDGIGEWCATAANPCLVVIDTLQRVRAPKQYGQTDYQADMDACEGLVRLCGQYNGLSIICAHHDRKQDATDVFDTVSGTNGLQGGVDTTAILKRSGSGVTLFVRGRDLKEEIEKAVNFDADTCRWHILGEASEVHQSDTRRAVLELLATCGTLTPRQLADVLDDMSYANAKQALWRMARDGLLENDKGVYRMPVTACHRAGVTASGD